jgi:hypothetical protein
MIELGATEMFFTSDTPTNNADLGAVPGELQTANFQSNADAQFDALDILQPNKPYMVAEFWSGWVLYFHFSKYFLRLNNIFFFKFDQWGQDYHDGSTTADQSSISILCKIEGNNSYHLNNFTKLTINYRLILFSNQNRWR